MILIKDIEQGTPEWHDMRLCIPTASNFKKIVTSTGKRSTQRAKYLFQKAGEIITGESEETYKNSYMELGNEREDEARQTYSFITGLDVEQVAFCYYDDDKEFGASPDGLIGEDGGFENKNAIPSVQLERLETGWKATEHKAQVQGCLLATGRKWWDIQSYCRGLKPIIIRIERDEEFIKNLHIELKLFYKEACSLAKKWGV